MKTKCLASLLSFVLVCEFFSRSYALSEDAVQKAIVVRHEGDTSVKIPDLTSSGWMDLFVGKDLSGWTQKNGWATYRIVDGAIEGTTSKDSPNSFLCTEKEYGDFEFTVEVRCDSRLNSGIQIRSKSLADRDNGRVHGPQVEIAPYAAGYIYGEATGRNWLSPSQPTHSHFKEDGWNTYVIRAQGKRMQTWINGNLIEDITDPLSSDQGFIGLQVHSIPSGDGPYTVQWRNIRIKAL
jgi:hypothetical protein